MLYQNKGDYDRAIADLDQAIDKRDPTAPKEPHVGANCSAPVLVLPVRDVL